MSRVIPIILQFSKKHNHYGLDNLLELLFNNRMIPFVSIFQDLNDT